MQQERGRQCWNHAPAESFIATLKTDLAHQEQDATRAKAKASISKYVKVMLLPSRFSNRSLMVSGQLPSSLTSDDFIVQ